MISEHERGEDTGEVILELMAQRMHVPGEKGKEEYHQRGEEGVKDCGGGTNTQKSQATHNRKRMKKHGKSWCWKGGHAVGRS